MPRPAMRTFLFSDLRDYTVFIETRGDLAATRMLRASRRIVRAAIAGHHGKEIATEGDSFYVVFHSPSSAVRCAIEMQREIAHHNERHPDIPIHMGIGINTGEAVPHDNVFVGSAVILASRLTSSARAGQILVTDTVRSLVRTGAHAPMRDLGTWTFKGITESVRIYEVDPLPSTAAKALGPALPLPALLIQPPAIAGGLVACPELIGREAQMTTLLEHLGAAARGESRIVALSGEPGVGKTRLCRELAALAHKDGYYVLAGRAHAERALAYEPLVAALRPYVRARGPDVLRRLLGPLVVELRRLVPELEISRSASADDVPEGERRDRFFRAVQLLVEDAAAQRPLLMVLEDLQEADASTLDMLRSLATSLRSGLCLVFTYREEDLGVRHPLRSVLAELERDRRVARVHLDPLDLEMVRRMTRVLLPGRATDELARAVYERSEGIPFYVEELLKTAVDDVSGALDLALPLSVRDSVHLRVGRLVAARGPQSGDLLDLLAVAGMPLGHELLTRATGHPPDEVAADLAAGVEAQLLERPPTRVEVFQFRHRVTRETVMSEIPEGRRRQLHADLAAALEEVATPTAAAMLARHFAAAGDVVKALRYAREGAAAASAVGAYSTAIGLLGQASGLAAGGSVEPEVLEELARALCAAGNAVDAEAALRRARALVPHDDAARLAWLEIQLAAALRMQGRRPEATEAAERALSLLEPAGDGLLGQALTELAELALAAGDAARAVSLAERALTLARQGEHRVLAVTALTVIGMAQSHQARPEALQTLREAIRSGSEAALAPETVSAWYELSRALLARGDFAEAGSAAETGLRLAREQGLEFLQARLLAHLTTILVNHGRYKEAREVAEQAVALASPGTIASDNANIALAHVLTNQGEHEAALRLFDQITPRIDRYDPLRRITFHSFRAQALVLADRLEEAASSAEMAVSETVATRGLGMTGFLAAASVAEVRRDLAGLRDLAHRFDRYFAGRDTGPIRACRAEIAAILVALDGGDAAGMFAELAATYDRLGARVHALYRRGSAAIAQLANGAPLREVRDQLHETRLALAERAAMRYVLLLDAAMSRRAARSRTAGPLVGRQLRVARMLGQGYTDQRVARELRVSTSQARRLVGQVLARLGVRSRSQVASWVVTRQPARETARAR